MVLALLYLCYYYPYTKDISLSKDVGFNFVMTLLENLF